MIRGRFRRKRAPRRHPFAFQDWRAPFAPPDERRRRALANALTRIALYREPRWPLAVGGDAGAAIGLTLERLWTNQVVDVRRDLILSALWISAAAGDPASQLLLRVMREKIDELEPE